MNELRIAVVSVLPVPDTAAFAFHLRAELADNGDAVESIALNAQLQVQPARRRYLREEQRSLEDLFGTPERWGTTLHPLYWTNEPLRIPAFHHGTEAVLRVPWPADGNAAVARYFHALQQDEIPVELLFRGTIFYSCGVQAAGSGRQIAFIPWSVEAACRIPEEVWCAVRRLVPSHGGRDCVARSGMSWNQLLDDVLARGKEKAS
jgi:hypothetical protein